MEGLDRILKTPRAHLLALAVIAITVVAGCGGSDSSEATEAPPTEAAGLTKTAWIAQADAICQRTNEKTSATSDEYDELLKQPETPKTIVELATVLKSSVPIVEDEIEQLRDLETPSGDEGTIDAMLSELEEGEAKVNDYADAIETGANSEAREIGRGIQDATLTARGMARGYGLKICGSNGD
jgi:hypothetical protein